LATGEGDEPGLLVCVRRDVDAGSVLTARTQDGVEGFDPDEHAVDEFRVERFVKTGCPSQVPVDEEVAGDELADSVIKAVTPECWVIDYLGCCSRVVDVRLEGGIQPVPCLRWGELAGGLWQDGAAGVAEEGGHPLGEVGHDVAGGPARTGAGPVPPVAGDAVDPVAKAEGDAAVPLCDALHLRSSSSSFS